MRDDGISLRLAHSSTTGSKLLVMTIFALLSSLFACTVVSVPIPNKKLTGIYTNLKFNGESGDVAGIEIFVVWSKQGYRVVFQDAEGSPRSPIVVDATISDKKIKFTLPERKGYSGEFVGEFVEDGIAGSFADGTRSDAGKMVRLKRSLSYWQ